MSILATEVRNKLVMLRNRKTSWSPLDICSAAAGMRGEDGGKGRERRRGAIHFNPPPPTWAKYAPFSFSPIFTFCCGGGTDEWKDTSLLSILQMAFALVLFSS